MDAGAAQSLDVAEFDLSFNFLPLLRTIYENPVGAYTPGVFARDLVVTRIFNRRIFLVVNPALVEQVLLTNQENYPKSPLMRNLLGPAIGQGLLLVEGENWRRQRRILAPAFAHRRVTALVPTMTGAARETLDRWADLPQPFDLAHEMSGLTMRIIALTMFSQDLGGDVDALSNAITRLIQTSRTSALDLIGAPDWIPRPRPRYGPQSAELERTMLRVLTARRADPVDRGDLISMLLAARDEETGEGMDDRQLRDEIMTIFLAGHETTANALTWALYLLSRNPEWEARLHQEVDEVLDGRLPTADDVANLKLTRRILDETMRLYPPAHSISRTALADDRFGSVRVPAGSLVSLSPYVTHRSPRLWPEPERFDPDRFLPERAAGRPRFAYFPFGGGPRICIGMGFALQEAIIILAMVAQRYRLRTESPTVEPFGRVTLRPKGGLWVSLTVR